MSISRMSAAQKIEACLQALAPLALTIEDDSHLHRHHREGGSGAHIRLRIVSAQFTGLAPLARHRLVYQTVGDLSALNIHALAISAQTPAEAAD